MFHVGTVADSFPAPCTLFPHSLTLIWPSSKNAFFFFFFFRSVCKLKEMNRGNRFLAVNVVLCSQELPHCKNALSEAFLLCQRKEKKRKTPGGGFKTSSPVHFTDNRSHWAHFICDKQKPKCWLFSQRGSVYILVFSVLFLKSSYKRRFTMNTWTEPPLEYAKAVRKTKQEITKSPSFVHFWLNQAQAEGLIFPSRYHSEFKTHTRAHTHTLTVD